LPGLTGKLVGQLYIFSEFGNVLDDHSHVKVTAIGLNQNYSRQTDATGRFELESMKDPIYMSRLQGFPGCQT
jgi:hypothetical protein